MGKGIDWDYLINQYSGSKNDSLKLKAVYFLKDNIEDLTSEIPEFYDSTGRNKIDFKLDTVADDASLRNIVSDNKYQYRLQVKYDTTFISTDILQSAIEDSYAIWMQNPWKMKIPKEIFFNYLLPYKILNEHPEAWRQYFYKRFCSAFIYKDSLNNIPAGEKRHYIDIGIEKEVVKQDTSHIFSSNMNVSRLTLFPGLSELISIKSGDCFSESNKNIYLYRSLGIPAAFDFTPQYGGGNAGHTTAVFWNDDLGRFTPKYSQGFNPDYMLAKAFRFSFKRQNIFKDSILPMVKTPDNFYIDDLKNEHWLDVTDEHVAAKDICVSMRKDKDTVGYGYICTYTYGQWKPIFWGKKSKDTFIFRKMGLGVLYQIALPGKNNYELTGNVFLLDSNGTTKYFVPDFQKRTSMTLERINYGSRAGVIKGASYTLKYLDKKGRWVSASTQTAEKDLYLKFNNIPGRTVYILFFNDPKARRLERPFLWENNRVKWL